jgi:putative transposase
MPNYRRAFVPGGCWFFTVNLLERRQSTMSSTR